MARERHDRGGAGELVRGYSDADGCVLGPLPNDSCQTVAFTNADNWGFIELYLNRDIRHPDLPIGTVPEFCPSP